MNKTEIESLLIERSKISAERAQYAQGYAELRAKLIPPEIQKDLDALNQEANEALVRVDAKLAQIDEQIKSGTLAVGETVTVKGVGQAVYNHGRITWDNKNLEGYVIDHPELLKFRKQGDPYITIK